MTKYSITVRALKKAGVKEIVEAKLGPLATDASGQLEVLRHDGHALGMDGAKVGVLEQADKVGLRSFLKGHDGRRLEAKVSLEILGNLPDKALEGELADEKLCRLLELSDLAERDSTRAVAVRLLHATSSRGRFAGSLGGKLLPGRL